MERFLKGKIKYYKGFEFKVIKKSINNKKYFIGYFKPTDEYATNIYEMYGLNQSCINTINDIEKRKYQSFKIVFKAMKNVIDSIEKHQDEITDVKN